MKISTCISFDDIETLEPKFARLAKNGFDSCQLHTWKREQWTDENVEIIKGYMKKYGIEDINELIIKLTR